MYLTLAINLGFQVRDCNRILHAFDTESTNVNFVKLDAHQAIMAPVLVFYHSTFLHITISVLLGHSCNALSSAGYKHNLIALFRLIQITYCMGNIYDVDGISNSINMIIGASYLKSWDNWIPQKQITDNIRAQTSVPFDCKRSYARLIRSQKRRNFVHQLK